jgi:hypothetical protein
LLLKVKPIQKNVKSLKMFLGAFPPASVLAFFGHSISVGFSAD